MASRVVVRLEGIVTTIVLIEVRISAEVILVMWMY